MYILPLDSFSFIELLNRGRHFALWKWRPLRYDGRRFCSRLWINFVHLGLVLLRRWGPLPSHYLLGVTLSLTPLPTPRKVFFRRESMALRCCSHSRSSVVSGLRLPPASPQHCQRQLRGRRLNPLDCLWFSDVRIGLGCPGDGDSLSTFLCRLLPSALPGRFCA